MDCSGVERNELKRREPRKRFSSFLLPEFLGNCYGQLYGLWGITFLFDIRRAVAVPAGSGGDCCRAGDWRGGQQVNVNPVCSYATMTISLKAGFAQKENGILERTVSQTLCQADERNSASPDGLTKETTANIIS